MRKAVVTLQMAASDNPLYNASETTDPTLFATAYKKTRFYSFSKRGPESKESGSSRASRDIFNEKPTREEQTVAVANTVHSNLGGTAILHTTYGDIVIRLFPEYAPKAVENFVEHSKKGYFNGISFHRVIKGFMIQTGDPIGDGTGGKSIWDYEFEDEFHPDVKHDRPYTVSMANAGPNTNASQFFITTVPTPHLDYKHTIFGRCISGADVINRIENIETDKRDRPKEKIRIMSITVR